MWWGVRSGVSVGLDGGVVRSGVSVGSCGGVVSSGVRFVRTVRCAFGCECEFGWGVVRLGVSVGLDGEVCVRARELAWTMAWCV